MTDEITDNTARHRFEMSLDGGMAFVAYRLTGNVVSLDHAEVPPALEGQGIGSRLVAATLAHVRSKGHKVAVHCDFVRAYMGRHPEFNDLLA